MDTEKTQTPKPTLKDQRARRARINRIKVGIIVFVMAVMVISVAMCIFLTVRSVYLQKQINAIVEYLNTEPTVVYDVTTYSESAPEETKELMLEKIADDDYEFPVVDNGANSWNEGDERQVYLTFDDGPSGNTEKILEILDRYGVKATFFCVGKEGEEYAALYKQIVDEGHSIGMHSYNHAYSALYASTDSFKEDFIKIHDLIRQNTGVDCRLYRFPGGSSNQVSDTDMNVFVDYLGENSVAYFDWNVSSGDGASQSYQADVLVENVLNNVVKYKESVVLLHDADAKDTTVEALPSIIEGLQERGCKILPIIDTTPAVHHNKISNGG